MNKMKKENLKKLNQDFELSQKLPKNSTKLTVKEEDNIKTLHFGDIVYLKFKNDSE
jgi:hypothetical protein